MEFLPLNQQTLTLAFLVLLIGVAIFLLLPEGNNKATNRAKLVGGSRGGNSNSNDKKGLFHFLKADDDASRRKSVEDTLNKLEDKKNSRLKRIKSLPNRLVQAGWSTSPSTFNMTSLIIGAVASMAVFFFLRNPIAALGSFVGVGFGVPRFFLNMAVNRRKKKFTSHFADAMDIIVRGVRTGLPLNDCLKIIAHESPEPVSTEFKRVVEAENLGMPIDVCLQQMYERMPVTEVNFFATVLNIQRQTGGNLGESLANLSNVLRGRKVLAEKIKALSAEAKMSAMIIAALPFIVGGLISVMAPDYMADLYQTEMGQRNIVIGFVMMALGIFVMKKMISFKY